MLITTVLKMVSTKNLYTFRLSFYHRNFMCHSLYSNKARVAVIESNLKVSYDMWKVVNFLTSFQRGTVGV